MRRKVLVVEDEPHLREAVSEALALEGFDVTQAASGDEAAGLIEDAHGFDLLLTDVQMPGLLDGMGVAARARARQPGLPIVVATGRRGSQAGVDALQPRCALVMKPYGLDMILDAIGDVCGGRGRAEPGVSARVAPSVNEHDPEPSNPVVHRRHRVWPAGRG